jgi:hypothetical protein
VSSRLTLINRHRSFESGAAPRREESVLPIKLEVSQWTKKVHGITVNEAMLDLEIEVAKMSLEHSNQNK